MNLQIRALSAVHQPDPEASEQEDGQVNSTSSPSELTTTHDEGTIKKVKTEEICDDDALQDDKSVIDDPEDMDFAEVVRRALASEPMPQDQESPQPPRSWPRYQRRAGEVKIEGGRNCYFHPDSILLRRSQL
jgi:hypothetical protein